MGGAFHDIGNSLSDRYKEARNFAGHAETGAFLFGKISQDLFSNSPNLLKLTQFAIAAHTHYTKPIEIKKNINGQEMTVTKKAYDNTLDGNNIKTGVWLTRWSDRLDAQGVQFFIRHALSKAEPTEDYDQEGFHVIKESEQEDFDHHFNPQMRTENFTHGRNVLEHVTMFIKSALNETVYSQHDTPYFTNELVKPNAGEQEEFIGEVMKETPVLPDEEINKQLETFYNMCRWVDGGSNIEAVIDLFKRKFEHLSKDQLSHWANGFSILPRLYNQMLLRVENKFTGINIDQEQNGVFREAQRFAHQKLEELKKAP